ncbi:MAG: PfkB family carbohydrate kinase [Candidatus Limnocylindria bacterium]
MIDERVPVDLLVVGALTVDRLGATPVPGGSVLYASESASRAGWRVAALTTCGSDPIAAAGLVRLRAAARVEAILGARTTAFTHRERGTKRASWIGEVGEAIAPTDPAMERLLSAISPGAVLFAPVADEIGPQLVARVMHGTPASRRVAAMQGWLRRVRRDVPLESRALDELHPELRSVLARADVLVASEADLDAEGTTPAARVTRLRAWCGPIPAIVLTMGREGALLDIGRDRRRIRPPRIISGVPTIGAGDAFAAVLASELGAGATLGGAATRASEAASALLAARQAT